MLRLSRALPTYSTLRMLAPALLLAAMALSLPAQPISSSDSPTSTALIQAASIAEVVPAGDPPILFRGVVVSYDDVGRILTVKETRPDAAHPEKKVVLADAAFVRLDGKVREPKNLAAGDRVILRYTMKEGRPVANSVRAFRELKLPTKK